MIEIINPEIKEMDELLIFLLCKFKEKKNMSISKFRAQKAIFKIKMELGENHPLYDCLPYYWYSYGPYSKVLDDSINDNANSCKHENNSYILKNHIYKEFN